MLRNGSKVSSGEGCSAILVSALTKEPNDKNNNIVRTLVIHVSVHVVFHLGFTLEKCKRLRLFK